tara:strand:+ start:3367 stop:4056 length:690 start_codon:yes stop_codon:yes gene_type:complete
VPLTERDTRKLINTKQASVEFQGTPSIQGMVDGQIAIKKKSNSQLALYRKQFGKLFHSFMTSDGNQIVEKKLTTNDLEYKHKFIDYRMFSHNFSENLSTAERFLPWVGPTDNTGMDDARNSLLVPFDMTCHRILFRPETLTSDPTSANLTFTIVRQDDGDVNVDTVATFQYTTDNISNDTFLTINESDFNNQPKVETGMKVGIKIQFDGDPASTIDYYITSVWRVEVEI